MNDKQLRQHILKRLGRANTVVEEFGVNHGQARADIAVFGDCIHAYELKSDLDTLNRLDNQVRAYSECFDKVTLVTSYKHAATALKMTPSWWGVVLAHEGRRGGIRLAEARRPKRNPGRNPISVSRMLWRDEALDLLKKHSAAKGLLSKPRKELYDRLAVSVPIDEITSYIINRVKTRKWTRAGAPSE